MKLGKDLYAIGFLSAIGVALIFGLSWQTDPNLKGLPFIPSWVYNWTDSYKNGTIRTAVPFFGLGLLFGGWFCMRNSSIGHFIKAWIVLTGVVVLAEFGQYVIPSRDADIKDISWGSAGSFFGLALMNLLLKFTRYFRKSGN